MLAVWRNKKAITGNIGRKTEIRPRQPYKFASEEAFSNYNLTSLTVKPFQLILREEHEEEHGERVALGHARHGDEGSGDPTSL